MISEYPKDRLYLRVGILLRKLMECAHDGNICNNLQLYLYLKQIEKGIKPDDTELVVKTEKHILSKNFTNQRCFREVDKDNVKSIIREYKLNSINI